MDILIKNMEMPKGDDDVKIIICSDGSVHRIIGWAISEKIKAKAIEVPPHGRLKDVDAFIEQNKEGFEEPLMQGEDLIGVRKIPMDAVSRALDAAPTVLEASE